MATKFSPVVHRNDGHLSQQHQQLGEEAPAHELAPLTFPSELYGRDIEQSTLLQLYELFVSSGIASPSSSEVVLIHGRQGTGKTALAHSLGALLEDQPCYFVSGRFDASDATNQAGLSMALTNFVDQIMQQNQEVMFHVRTSVLEAIPDREDIISLSTRIPNLLDLVDIDVKKSSRQTLCMISPQRILFLLSCLTQSLAGGIQNDWQLTMFLDDLHHASKQSVHFLQSLLTAPTPPSHHSIPPKNGMLVLLTYCQEQVPWDSPLQGFLTRMQHSSFNCTTMETRDLEVQDVDAIVQAALQHENTLPLSRLIFHKTRGNAYHVVEFLKMVHREGFLDYNENHGGWNLMRIQGATDVTENVVRDVSFHQLHWLVKDVLKLAACLGKRFSASVLSNIALKELLEQQNLKQSPWGNASVISSTTMSGDDDTSIVLVGRDENAAKKIDLVLKIAFEESLLESAAKGELKFTHERVRQSLLLFIPKDKRPFLHLRIGRHLRARIEDDQNMDLVFQAVDQFNRAALILRNRKDIIDLCQLNFRAGRIAFENKLSFQEGAEFVEMAATIAGMWGLWKHEYDLALDIFSTSARYEAYLGRMDRSHQLVSVVFEKARHLSDKIPAYLTKMECLAVEEYVQDAIDLGLDLLKKLYEGIPPKPKKSDHVKEFLSLSLQLRRHEDIKSLELMHDIDKLASMKILRLLCQFTFILQDDNLFPLVCLRSMSLTLQWGLSPCAASAVASYAVILGLRQDPRSIHFGHQALEIHERYSDKGDEGFMLLQLSRFVSHWRQSMRTQLDMFERAFAVAFDSKHILVASMAAYCQLEIAFLVGSQLDGIQRDFISLSRSVIDQSNEVVKGAALPLLQLISCLKDRNGNFASLSGELLDERKFDAACRARGNDIARLNLYYYQIAHAFFFQNWQRAVDLYEHFQSESQHLFETFKAHFLYPPLLLHVGVAYYAMAKSSSVHSKHAKRILREVSHFTVGATDDGRQTMATVCLAVLEAEQALLHRSTGSHHKEGDHVEKSCCAMLEIAMAVCRDNKLLHYEAAVAARASIWFEDTSKAVIYRTKAKSLNKKWGSILDVLNHQEEN